VYARPTVDGKLLSFGVSGKLWKDALVMYDRETGTLWSHVTGVAIQGKLSGMRLDPIPALQTAWAEWKRTYPNGLVLSKGAGLGPPTGMRNVYESYFKNEEQLGIFGTKNPDQRLPGKEYVVGLVVDRATVAYPFRHLSRQPLVNDVIDGRPVVVTFSAGSATGAVFSRAVGGRFLTFGGFHQEQDQLVMTDAETATTWHAVSGEAIRGPLRGTRLFRLPSTLSFWFAWKGFYPGTRLWEP
jgi:hypothetical protein